MIYSLSNFSDLKSKTNIGNIIHFGISCLYKKKRRKKSVIQAFEHFMNFQFLAGTIRAQKKMKISYETEEEQKKV